MASLGLTQEDLKGAFGVTTRGAVGHYLTGRRTPTPEQLISLADLLQCSVGWLLVGEAGTQKKSAPPDAESFIRALGNASSEQVHQVLEILGLPSDMDTDMDIGDDRFPVRTPRSARREKKDRQTG